MILFDDINLADRKHFVSNPRYVIEEAMTNDMLDIQINFMHDCSRDVIEELWLFREMIVTNFKVCGEMKKL